MNTLKPTSSLKMLVFPRRAFERTIELVYRLISFLKLQEVLDLHKAHRLTSILVLSLFLAPWGGGQVFGSVTDRGSYQTSIPIEVPSFHDITPEIALVYDSNTRNGPLGYGWSLMAGSQITRSSKPTGVPHYDASDQLWLDGMELFPCNPPLPLPPPNSTSCKTGGTHTTRVENFGRISLDTEKNTWTLWNRDGTRFIYSPRFGDVSSSELAHQWIIAEVIDVHGNRIEYQYNCGSNFVCYLSQIAYGDGKTCTTDSNHPVGTPITGVRIQFYWEHRRDDQSTAIGNALAVLNLRLRTIDVSDNDRRIRIYQINYRPDITGASGYKDNRSWIESVQMYGSDAQVETTGSGKVISGTALPSFTFEAPSFLYGAIPSFLNTQTSNRQFRPIGPTTPDLKSIYDSRLMQMFPPSNMVIRTHRPNVPMAVTVSNKSSATVGDFDGDGRLDFVEWGINGICTNLKTKAIMAAGANVVHDEQQLPQANLCMSMAFPSDLDGDGRTDLLFLRYRRADQFDPQNLKYEAEAIPALSNGNGTFEFYSPSLLWTSDDQVNLLLSRCGIGDLDGDGRADLVCTVRDGTRWNVVQAFSLGHKFEITVDRQVNTLTNFHLFTLGDANGDGLSDLIVIDQIPGITAGLQLLQLKIGASRGGSGFVWETIPTTIVGTNSEQQAKILIGDFNGDARADVSLAIINDDASGGSFTTFTSQGGASPRFQVKRQTVEGRMFMASVGDRNGDGMDDLLLSIRHAPHDASFCGQQAIAHDHQSLLWAISSGDGTFNLPTEITTCYQETDWPWPYHPDQGPYVADVNGDRIVDEFFFYPFFSNTGNDYTENFLLSDLINPHFGSDAVKWRSTDINGDGRTDWVYLNFGNPGLIILSQITQSDGTRHLVRSDITPSASSTPPDLTKPHVVSNWFLVDIGGGPSNSPDGMADIVLVDDVSRQIVTLLSNGDGTWRKTVTTQNFSLMTVLRNVLSKPTTGDLSNWHAIDTNGDGLTDLVHISFIDAVAGGQAALHVTTLRARGNGDWNLVPSGDYVFNGNLTRPDVRGFRPADVNGDGRTDLIKLDRHVQGLPLGHNASVWSLIANSDGTWDDRHTTLSLPYGLPKQWWPMEINGDGRTDIAFFMSHPDHSLGIYRLLSLGNGRWDFSQNTWVWPVPVVDTSSSTDFRIVDLDQDGKQDIVHLSKTNKDAIATMVIWNRYPDFVQNTTTNISLGGTNVHEWHLSDSNGDDFPELVRIDAEGTKDLDEISIPVLETRLTRNSNGMGGSELIVYGTSVGKHSYMPLGLLAHVVKWVGTRAEGTPGPPESSVDYTYQGAVFSKERRGFLGFTHLEMQDDSRILASDLELTSYCGGRRSVEELFDTERRLIQRTHHIFESHLLGARLPFICRVQTVRHEEWEKANTSRISEDQMNYDFYGNLTRLVQTGDLANSTDDRVFESSVMPNEIDYIVNRPSNKKVLEIGDQGKWKVLSETLYEYDYSNDHTLSPGKLGELTRERHWNNQTNDYADSLYQYDQRGNPQILTGPSIPSNLTGVVATVEYDCQFQRFPVTTCTGLFCDTGEWDKGRLSKVTDSNSSVTQYFHDVFGRQERIVFSDNSFEKWIWPTFSDWGKKSQAIIHQRSDGSKNDGVLWEKQYFDGLGRTTKIQREGNITEEILQYDGSSSRVRSRTAPHFTNEDGAVTHYDYDSAGRLRLMTHPDGSKRNIQYKVGEMTVVDELHASKQYAVDPFGRITMVRENLRNCLDETCPIIKFGITSYFYDARDLPTRLVDAHKNLTEWQWDSLGHLLRSCDPDRGCTLYSWNDDGTEKSVTNANEAVVRSNYDSQGRLINRRIFEKGSSTPTRTITWTWDTDKVSRRVRGSSIDRITHVEDTSSNASQLFSYRYDGLGRVDLSQSCIDGRCFEVQMGFDLAGRISSIRYPDLNGNISTASERLNYVYGEAGFLDSLPGYVNLFKYNASGNCTYIQFMNGIEEWHPHDPSRGWNTGVEVNLKSGRQLFSQTVLHDKVGRVLQQAIAGRGSSQTDTYSHDDLGRLTQVSSTDRTRNQTFTYDLIGNLVSHSRLGTISYADPKHVHAMTSTGTGESYAYDNLGQMISSNTLSIGWGHDNHPNVIRNKFPRTTSVFAYDIHGKRVKKQTAAGVNIYTNPYVVANANGTISSWILANDRLIVRHDSTNEKYFFHADYLDSTRLVTDSSGAITDRYDYGILGEEQLLSTGSGITNRFTGSYHDDETGLNYMNARYYDANNGHFISPDDIIPNLYDPQSLNRYTYALNDPVTLIDPSGHSPCGVVYHDTEFGGPGIDFTDCYTDPSGDDGLHTVDREPREIDITRWDTLIHIMRKEGIPFETVNGHTWEDLQQLETGNVAVMGWTAINALPIGAPPVGSKPLIATPNLASKPVAGSMPNINPLRKTLNCVNCAIALDATLSGQPASALGGGPFKISVLEKFFKAKFGPLTSLDQVTKAMRSAGPGARGIVYGSRGPGTTGHVFNAVTNKRGVVKFLDGQTGKYADTEPYLKFMLLRTN